MKRASLSALPARPQAEPADLTDRLLDREASMAPDDTSAPVAEAPKPPARRRARPAKPAAPIASEAATPEAAPETTLDQALQQATTAAEALRQAAHTVPARYELAVRYRLQALAHHVQQVAEFIAGRVLD